MIDMGLGGESKTGWGDVPNSWKSMAIVAGLPILGYFWLSKRRCYEKWHKEIFGIEPLPYVPLHKRPIAWVRRELLFGWVDLLAAEIQGQLYFTFHPEEYEKWRAAAEDYFGKPEPKLPPRERIEKLVKDLPKRARMAWTILVTGQVPTQR